MCEGAAQCKAQAAQRKAAASAGADTALPSRPTSSPSLGGLVRLTAAGGRGVGTVPDQRPTSSTSCAPHAPRGRPAWSPPVHVPLPTQGCQNKTALRTSGKAWIISRHLPTPNCSRPCRGLGCKANTSARAKVSRGKWRKIASEEVALARCGRSHNSAPRAAYPASIPCHPHMYMHYQTRPPAACPPTRIV